MSEIKLDIPDITVLIDKGDEYRVTINKPGSITKNVTGSYITVADSALTSSYALSASYVAGGTIGSASYAESALTSSYALSASYVAGGTIGSASYAESALTSSYALSASYATTASYILGSVGNKNSIPLWSSNSQLSSSILYQTQSGILINSQTQHTPAAPDTLGIFASQNNTSYNLVSGHGNVDNYLQVNIKNFNSGPSASTDIVATADIGNESFGYVDMGINSSNYVNNGNGIGNALDAYLYTQNAGDLLIGNKSVNKRIVIFSGEGNPVDNARILADPSGSVGINTGVFDATNPEALLVQSINDASFNLIKAYANPNSYIQFNIQNIGTGNSASSDIVATADNGNESVNYIDMGINGSQYGIQGLIGGVNDAYLYSTGQMLHIGNATPGQDIMFFVGSTDVEADKKLTLRYNNQHQLTGSLEVTQNLIVNGTLTAKEIQTQYVTSSVIYESGSTKFGDTADDTHQFTGSLSVLGTISGAIKLPLGTVSSSAQYPGWVTSSTQIDYNSIQNKLSGVISSSAQFNALSGTSASFATTASAATSITFTPATASYAVTASYAANAGGLAGVVSSSTQFKTLTDPFTGSFTGSFTGDGSGLTGIASTLTFSGSTTGNDTLNLKTEALIFSGSNGLNATVTNNTVTFAAPDGTVSASSQIDYNNITNKLSGVVSSSQQVAPLLPNGTVSSSAQYPGWVTSSTQIDYNSIQNKLSGVVSSSAQVTASISGAIIIPSLVTQSNFDGYQVKTNRYLELAPTDTTITTTATTAKFYVSGSNNDLWYSHKTNSTVNFDWIEGVLETGLLYGGIAGFSGSNVYIRQGAGIIVTHGATTSSAPSPTVNYVTWPNTTSSIDVTNGYVTYLSIGASGQVISSSTKFNSLDYHDSIPLGAVGHFNQQAIAAKGEQINTQYSAFAQLTDFARNFGPIKVGGYGITPQSGSLKFSRAAGDAFIYGGFHSQNPETPSNFQSSAVTTGSLAYIYRTGSAQGYAIDANNNTFFTSIKPGFYDVGGTSGTASLASNEWSIQRVFIEPVTGIHYIYFGQNKYTSLANAVANLTTDTFAEGPATSLFTVFIGYLIAKGDTTNLADTGSNSIVNAGLFRNTSAGSVGGGAAAQLLNDLSDVTITSATNGQALIYSSGDWVNGIPTSASFAISASWAPGGAGTVTQVNSGDGLTGGPITGTGTLSLNTGSAHFTTGTVKALPDGTISSSAQYPGWVTASSQIDYNSIQNKLSGVVSSSTQVQPLLPGGTVSASTQYPGWVTSSTQIDYNNIQNKLSGVVSSSAQVAPLLPEGTVSSSAQYPGWVTASSQIDYNSIQNKLSGVVSSSQQIAPLLPEGTVSSSAQYPGWVTASSQVVYTQLQSIPGGIVSSSAQYPGWVTASSQIDYNNIQNKLSGVVSSSQQVAPLLPGGTLSSSAQYPGWVTASSQIDYNSIQNKLSGVVSSSTQVAPLLPDGTVSASAQYPGWVTASSQVVYTQLQSIPGGIVSSSAQYPGWVTASSQIDYNQIQNKLSGVISSSTQFNALTGTSASFATTASYASSGSWLRTKSGVTGSGAFTGNPRTATITFTTAFPNTNYAVVVTGEDSRAWSIQNKLAGSFVINSNSNTALAGNTYWIATAYGET